MSGGCGKSVAPAYRCRRSTLVQQAYLKPDLLILDELGYRSMAESTIEDFYEIVSKRYEKGSIIITTNRPVSEWGKVFIDKRLATAIVDRFMHHHRLIEITGESWFVSRMPLHRRG